MANKKSGSPKQKSGGCCKTISVAAQRRDVNPGSRDIFNPNGPGEGLLPSK